MKMTSFILTCWLLVLFFSLVQPLQAEVRGLQTLDRDLEPMEVSCDKFTDTLTTNANFNSDSLANLFGFAYHAGNQKWMQIPIQIDDRNKDYDYIFTVTGKNQLLDSADVMAVMLKDLGDQVSENTWIFDSDSRNYARYEIRAQDPATGKYGWFYLYKSTTYEDTVITDYVDAGPDSNHIFTDIYTIGHNSRGTMDHISFPPARGMKGFIEIIDRQKVRLKGKAKYYGITKEYNDTEDQLELDEANYIDGNVRVIQEFKWHITKKIGFIETDIPFDLSKIYYQHSVKIDGKTTIDPEFGCDLLRLSIDIHPDIAGALFYNAKNDGLVLDMHDNVTLDRTLDIPGTFWALTASVYGSFLQLITIDQAISSSTELYYCERDHGTRDNPDDWNWTTDTGDMKSWGDVGLKLRGNITGQANLGTDLYLFNEDLPSMTAEQMANNHSSPVNWWGGILAQNYDGTAPAVVNLIASNRGDDFIDISWLAPGDDGQTGGPAAVYEMRYSTLIPMVDPEIWWEIATSVADMPVPGEPGAMQTATVSDLTRETTYFFKMCTKDDAGNWSEQSSAISARTTPVELAAFSYSLPDNGVRLEWRTSSETNNYGFEIERKTGDFSFEAIGFIEGSGTTSAPQSYSFIDKNVGSGTYYYRLKQLDYDGKFEFSSALEVNLSGPADFSLAQNYPNPFNSETTISFALRSVESDNSIEAMFQVDLAVYNILGQKVKTLISEEREAGRHSIYWNGVDDFSQSVAGGVYFYHLSVKSLVDGRQVWSKMNKMILMP